MTARMQVRLWAAQRLSAMVLGLCVFVHLITIMVAMRSGLSANDILGRTQGNWIWFAFYLVFVGAVVVHVPLGLRTVLEEWMGWRGFRINTVIMLFTLVLGFLGVRAAWAVFV